MNIYFAEGSGPGYDTDRYHDLDHGYEDDRYDDNDDDFDMDEYRWYNDSRSVG